MPSINTLVDDIYRTINSPPEFDPGHLASFTEGLVKKITYRLTEDRGTPMLRASNLGKPCDRQLWYEINTPQDKEPLPPAAKFKFLFGDILEELLIFLAKASGHDVQHEQKEISVNGLKGHIDAIIDGRLVDAKSASTYSFKKFESHGLQEDDAFGYIDQAGIYLEGAKDLEGLVDKDVSSFLVVDKTLGNITLDTYPKPDKDYTVIINAKREMLSKPEPPERGFQDEPHQKSGNRKLGVNCSYCPFKHRCWHGLQWVPYAGKPVWLTVVARAPKVRSDF